MVANGLFGDYQLISNETHQALLNYNEILLGAHNINGKSELYPSTLRADLPAYLLKGRKNLRPESIENLGFGKRAKKLGVYQRLRQANVMPHVGGYTFPQLLSIERVYEMGGGNDTSGRMQLMTGASRLFLTFGIFLLYIGGGK